MAFSSRMIAFAIAGAVLPLELAGAVSGGDISGGLEAGIGNVVHETTLGPRDLSEGHHDAEDQPHGRRVSGAGTTQAVTTLPAQQQVFNPPAQVYTPPSSLFVANPVLTQPVSYQQPVVNPVVVQPVNPVVQPITQPIFNPVTQPIFNPITQPVFNPIVVPVAPPAIVSPVTGVPGFGGRALITW